MNPVPAAPASPRRRAAAPRVVAISDDAFACCVDNGWWRWTLSYVLRGTYGNYLLGEPPYDAGLVARLQAFGGVSRVLPFRAALPDDAPRWRRQLGCTWVAPGAVESPASGWVPTEVLGDAPLPGLEAVAGRVVGPAIAWRFRWRGLDVVAGPRAATGRSDAGSLALPETLLGSRRALEERLAALQGGARRVVASEWLAGLRADENLVCWAVDSLGLVACFDDVEFEGHDVEIVTPVQRAQLGRLLVERGFERVSGHCYRDRRVVVRLAKPPRIVTADPVTGLALRPGEVGFVTSTQAAYQLLHADGPPERRLAEIGQLVARLPVNLAKLGAVLAREPALLAGHDPTRVLAGWRERQAGAVAHYVRRRPDGLRGRLYEPDGAS